MMERLMVFMKIPAGPFLMGSEDGQDCERPVHPVWVDAFGLAPTQETNAQYAKFVAAGQPPPPEWNKPAFNDPLQQVVGVSWFDAIEYCDWLGKLDGKSYRLPTEAEW